MERRNLALLCAGVLCFWLFALAFGTAEGRGVAVQAELPTAAPAAVEDVPVVDAAAQSQLSLNCRAAILVDQDTGTVLYEKNADEQVPIASITKVMTLLLTFEAIHNGQLTLETTVPVSEHAYHMGGSQIWLEPGEQFTLDEMIKAICVSSANDAAVAVAELVGGSEQGFVQSMNARAAELGMTNTVFHNACGLDAEGHLGLRQGGVIQRHALLCAAFYLYKQRLFFHCRQRHGPVGRKAVVQQGGSCVEPARADLPDALDAPVQQGQAVGTVRVLSGETLLGEYEIRAAADAPKMDFGTAFGLLWGALTGRDG